MEMFFIRLGWNMMRATSVWICMVFGHDDITCLKHVVDAPKKNGLKTCLKKNGATTSGTYKNAETIRSKVSTSNLFDALKTVVNDDKLGANRGISRTADNMVNPNVATRSLGTNKENGGSDIGKNKESVLLIYGDAYLSVGKMMTMRYDEDEREDLMEDLLAFCYAFDITLRSQSRC
ncbi:hypothetical protein Tco_0788739 [Tanacetum coccineum]